MLPLAVCVLLEHEGRFLFVERAQGRFAAGYWTPVTGRPEPGESLADAASREVLEETGLRVLVGRELGRTGSRRRSRPAAIPDSCACNDRRSRARAG